MIKRYIEFADGFDPITYNVVINKTISSISTSNVKVKRISEGDFLIIFDWNSGFKKGVKVSLTDLEVLTNLHKIILSVEPEWLAGKPKLFEAKEVEDI